MNRLTLCLLVVALATAASPAGAQDQPTLFVSSWMCDRGAIDGLVTMANERDLPIYQEMTDEGLILGQMVLVHHWGDEWNYVTITMAPDIPAGLAADEEFIRRYSQLYGEDDGGFVNHCPSHRDAIYQGAFNTVAAAGSMPEPPFTVAMSYFNCPLNKVSEVEAGDRARLLPAAEASIADGHGLWLGAMRHAWADEWSYVLVRAATDIASLVAFNDDTNRRMASAPGAPAPTDACRAHRDNIYTLVMTTTNGNE